MGNLLSTALLIAALLLLYRYRARLWAALVRFDRGNRTRAEQEVRDRADPLAHLRHTIAIADEQIEKVQEIQVPDTRTGLPVTLYLFAGDRYETRDEAEQARAHQVRESAMRFYRELPAALSARRGTDTRE